MSYDLMVSSVWMKFPGKDWEFEVSKKLKGFGFDSRINWKEHEGYTPCKWEDTKNHGPRIRSGFEFYLEDNSYKKKTKFFGMKVTKRDWSVTLSMKSDEMELGWIAAAQLAKYTSGILTDPQTGEEFEGNKAINAALERALSQIEQPAVVQEGSGENEDLDLANVKIIDPSTLGNEKLKNYSFAAGLYSDQLFPDFLADKCKNILIELCWIIEKDNPQSLQELYELTNYATEKINYLQDEIGKNGAEIETSARETLAENFEAIANAYGFENADIEELIADREW